MVKIGSLFSGIGGLELGLEQAGVGEVVFQAEIDPFCRTVLAKHWPDVKRFDDVFKVDGPRVDLICGGAPCQPVSVAGARKGKDDERWLWPEYARIVRDLEPSWVVVENVPGLRTLGLLDVLRDLAALGFDADWTTLSAADCGAPHLRRRLFLVASHPERVQLRLEPGWLGRACRAGAAQLVRDGVQGLVADTDDEGEPQPGRSLAVERGRAGDGGEEVADTNSGAGGEGRAVGGGWASRSDEDARPGSSSGGVGKTLADPDGSRREGSVQQPHEGRSGSVELGSTRPPLPRLGGVADGVSAWLDGSWEYGTPRTAVGVEGRQARLKSLGNAVVPACAYVVGRAIVEACGV